MTYLISDKAATDLLEVWDYGHKEWGLEQADHYHDQILKNVQFLSDHPLAGTDRSSLAPEYRSFGVGSHIIFYREQGPKIVVIRVLHKRADFERHL